MQTIPQVAFTEGDCWSATMEACVDFGLYRSLQISSLAASVKQSISNNYINSYGTLAS